MPVPTEMGVSLAPDQLAAAKLDINSVKDVLNTLITVNLTKPERQAIHSVAEERLPYVQTAFDSLIGSYPNLLPPFSDLPAAQADYAYMTQLRGLGLLVQQVMEIVSDHELAAGALAFEYMRDFYDVGKRAAERNVPGADTVVDALSPLFERENEASVVPLTANGGGNVTV